MMRGSKVTRRTPRAGTSVRSTDVPGHDARVEGHAQDATGWDVGALDRLRSEHGPAREGGADEEEDNAQGSHQQNGTRRMADAVFATPRHGRGFALREWPG